MGTATEIINWIFTVLILHYMYGLSIFITERIEETYGIKILNPDNKNLLRKIIERIFNSILKK